VLKKTFYDFIEEFQMMVETKYNYYATDLFTNAWTFL